MTRATMRTLGFRTHVLLAVAAAAGVLVALGLPWYAPSPGNPGSTTDVGQLDGHMERTFATVGRALASTDGATGWHALGSWATPLAVLAALAGVLTLLCVLPTTQGVAREGARLAALAAVALVAWKLIDHPGAAGATELRHGALAAAASAVILVSAACSVAGAPLRRGGTGGPRGRAAYQAPPPPSYDQAGSIPPPGR